MTAQQIAASDNRKLAPEAVQSSHARDFMPILGNDSASLQLRRHIVQPTTLTSRAHASDNGAIFANYVGAEIRHNRTFSSALLM
jgi:hypothetical protein